MIEQVVVDDIVELLIGVLGGDTLVEAVSDVVGVLFGRYARIELIAAAPHLAAVANGRTLRPEKAGGRFELFTPLMVDTENDSTEVTDPGLVAGWVAGHVK